MLYILNLYSTVCQLYFNKTGRQKYMQLLRNNTCFKKIILSFKKSKRHGHAYSLIFLTKSQSKILYL